MATVSDGGPRRPPSGPEMLQFVTEVMTTPYAVALVGDLAARQPRSAAIADALRRRSPASPVLWPFHAVQLPVAIREARGAKLVDVDGAEYLDLFLGFGTQALFGHNPPAVVDAVQRALVTNPGNGYLHEVELALIDVLRALAPDNEAFAFLNAGTDATGAAVRICRAATGRRLIVKVESAVHGTHDWGVQSSVALMHGHPIVPWPTVRPDGVEAVPFATGVAASSPAELLVLPHLDTDAFALLEARRGEIAAVIAEPCNISFPFADRCIPYVRALAERCKALGLLFILDEVQTGFRWGPGGAAHTERIPADLRVYGKVLSGLGIPLSAVGGPTALLRHAGTSGLNVGDYGQKTTLMTTHTGNHLALAASHASLSLLRDAGPYHARTEQRRAALDARIARLRAERGIPLHLVGYGQFIGTLMFADRPSEARDARDLAGRANPAATLLLSLALRRRGIYTYSWPFVFLGDAYTDADLARIADEVVGAATEIADAGVPLYRTA